MRQNSRPPPALAQKISSDLFWMRPHLLAAPPTLAEFRFLRRNATRTYVLVIIITSHTQLIVCVAETVETAA